MSKDILFLERYKTAKYIPLYIIGSVFILLIIYFFSIPKILMIGFPGEMVYQYNGPFVFDNLDTIGNKNINKLVDFDNYDLIIFRINPQMIVKYGYNEKLSNFTGKIIVISNSESDKSQIAAMAPKSKVYMFNHFPNSVELKKIL